MENLQRGRGKSVKAEYHSDDKRFDDEIASSENDNSLSRSNSQPSGMMSNSNPGPTSTLLKTKKGTINEPHKSRVGAIVPLDEF